MESYYYDLVIAGSGVAGLVTALGINEERKVLIITKEKISDSNSSLAQGGICVKNGADDFKNFYEDTMKAGHYENSPESVRILIEESQNAIKTLESYGVEFDKEDGEYSYTREGGHSGRRIVHVEDFTGKAVMEALKTEVLKRKNVEVSEDTELIDLLVRGNKCRGVLAYRKDGTFLKIGAGDTVLATGGIGGLYENTTNFRHIKGDGCAIALKNKVAVKDISYVQFHPTSFYEKGDGRRFLISESVRGEGALLRNAEGKRFINELLPRDIVTAAVRGEMERYGKEYVTLDIKPIGSKFRIRFPAISEYVDSKGTDPEIGEIKVVPAQHYTMGGIKVDTYCRTSMKHLYAVGEAANTGVHGKNRLASNSLLEGVVFSKRCAADISSRVLTSVTSDSIKLQDYKKPEKALEFIRKDAGKLIMEKIKNEKIKRAQ